MINNKLFIIIVRLTNYVFGISDIDAIKKTFKIIFKMLKSNGTKFTVNYLKQSRLLITRYLCGKPILVNDHFISTFKGFPTKFIFLKEYIDSGNITKIKFCLTLMNISRTIDPKKNEVIKPDYSSITNPCKKRLYTVPSWFVDKWITDNNLSLKQHEYTTKDFFISLKQGPHGPSILSILYTIKWIRADQLKWLHTLINNNEFFVRHIGRFYSFVKHNTLIIPTGNLKVDKDKSESHRSTGRLSIVDDPECKKRIIAISDYFTQFTLRPIHSQLLNLLKSLSTDRTFTQDPHTN